MKRNHYFLMGILLLISTAGYAQMGIGTTAPNPSAMLDVVSNAKGLLTPRMTTTERVAIPSPADGLLVYDTDTHSFWFYKNGVWTDFGSGGNLWSRSTTNTFLTNTGDNVGIGTTTPAQKLDVVGNALISGNMGIFGGSVNSSYGINFGNIAINQRAVNITIPNPVGSFPNFAAGIATSMTSLGNATTSVGIYNETAQTTSASANLMGAYNKFTSGSSGVVAGVYNELTNTSSGRAYGMYSLLNGGAGSALLYGGMSMMEPNSVGDRMYGFTSYSGGDNGTTYGFFFDGESLENTATEYAFFGDFYWSLAGKKWGLYINAETANYLSGKIGLGTTTPSNQLHVNATNPARLEGLQPGSETNVLVVDASGVVKTNSGIGTGAGLWSRNSTNTYLTNIGDHVGIGTTNPQSDFHYYDPVGETSVIFESISDIECLIKGTEPRLSFYDSDNSSFVGIDWGQYNGSTDNLFYVWGNPTDKFLFELGNVGIGSTDPLFKTHIHTTDAENLLVSSDGTAEMWFRGGESETEPANIEFRKEGTPFRIGNITAEYGTPDAGWFGLRFDVGQNNQYVRFMSSEAEAMRVTGDLVGIGATNPRAKLHVGGVSLFTRTAPIPEFLPITSKIVYIYDEVLGISGSGRSNLTNEVIINVPIAETDNYTNTVSDMKIQGNAALSGQMINIQNPLTYSSTSTATDLTSQYSSVENAASGTISLAYGYRTQLRVSSTGPVTEYHNIKIHSPLKTGTGVITRVAGLSVENITQGTNNTNLLLGQATIPNGNFSIYNASSNANYFNGNVGIGTTAPAVTLDVNGSTQIGTYGTTVANVIKATVSKDVANVPANSSIIETFAVPNAATTASVMISPQNALADGLLISYARVSATGTIEVKFRNETAAAINPATMNFYITVVE